MEIEKTGICSFLLLIAMLSSCADSSAQDVSRSVKSSSITPYSSESVIESSEAFSSEVESSETSEPRWRDQKPSEFEFNLSFSENMLKVDYGKTSVNVYRAQYAEMLDNWGEEWSEWGASVIYDWCIGLDQSIWGGEEGTKALFFSPDPSTSIYNAHNVHEVKLNELDDFELVTEKTGIDPDTDVLCWTFDIKGFPKEFGEESFFVTPTDMTTVKYMRVANQYLDNLPVYGESKFFFGCTYEWGGVIEPSRATDGESVFHNGPTRINPSHTCIFQLKEEMYTVGETVLTDLSITAPELCLDGIKEALLYDPCAAIGNDEIGDVWGKDIEVYCMELAYAAVDSTPRNYDESKEEHLLHKLYLVPVWEVYYTIHDPVSNKINCGMVIINAVTGESLFSDKYGPEENTELYPDLLLPG